MNDDPAFVLTRDAIRSGAIREVIARHDRNFIFKSDEELAQSRNAMFPAAGIDGDIWLFAYGSLIWNPTIRFAERRPAKVFGVHRRFCLKLDIARGSRTAPGLMLGLDRGGCCRGVAFRIAQAIAEEELEIIWRREMVGDAYRPRWLRAHTADGVVPAIGFTVDRTVDRYFGGLPETEAAAMIARASGFLGSCRDYLDQTAEHLRAFGIADACLDRLQGLVRQIAAVAPGEGGR